jgi:hypothetical protein
MDETFASLERRDGTNAVQTLLKEIKPLAFEGMYREMVCQFLSSQSFWLRVKFFALYPEYFLPYLVRIRREK